jgi:hypothetical protein
MAVMPSFGLALGWNYFFLFLGSLPTLLSYYFPAVYCAYLAWMNCQLNRLIRLFYFIRNTWNKEPS